MALQNGETTRRAQLLKHFQCQRKVAFILHSHPLEESFSGKCLEIQRQEKRPDVCTCLVTRFQEFAYSPRPFKLGSGSKNLRQPFSLHFPDGENAVHTAHHSRPGLASLKKTDSEYRMCTGITSYRVKREPPPHQSTVCSGSSGSGLWNCFVILDSEC